jgi:hypothetical protein
MAIIFRPPTDPSSPDSAIDRARPAILVRDGTFQSGSGEPWTSMLDRARANVERAIRAVGRLEMDNATIPWVGTAFIIGQTRAVTASFVAEALVRGRGADGPVDGPQSRLDGVWLNLKAEHGSTLIERIAIDHVRFVHPYWGFAFLELAHPVEPNRVLSPATKPSEEDVAGRDICVIGYPGRDIRNEPDVMNAIFKDIYGVKRIMPGKSTGLQRWGAEQTIALMHDATTLGGTSGAPIVDIKTGDVLGIQIGGTYLVSNYAVAAWEIDRDPQWSVGSHNGTDSQTRNATAAALQSIESSPQHQPLLQFEEVLSLHEALVKIGMTDQDKIRVLFGGLPPEYVSALPDQGGGAADRLLSMLHAMNEIGGRVGAHSGFYYVLKNAERMRSWDSAWTEKVKDWTTVILNREAAIVGG